MNTWTFEAPRLLRGFDLRVTRLSSNTRLAIGAVCRRTAFALTALFALSACDGGGAGDLFAALPFKKAQATDAPDVALSQSQMANGALTLVPPQGFCIDKTALRQRFALMARCDALGAPSLAAAAPVGIIAISVVPASEAQGLPTPKDIADAAKLSNVEDVSSTKSGVTFKARGTAPAAGLGATHWRGSFQINDHLLGLALYGPKDGRAASAEGREILNGLIRRSRTASGNGS